MNLLSKITDRIPFGKKEELIEYFFAIGIGIDRLTAALWSLKGKHLSVLDVANSSFKSQDDLTKSTDTLLDKILGAKDINVEKVLFGVPESWLIEDDLKDEYLKFLRNLVKELELQPMAYVATSHALVHFLEKQDGIPPTAILVGFEEVHLNVTIVRAGKVDGTKSVNRTSNAGSDIEKSLLNFTGVETLPSKILLYSSSESGKLEKLKSELLSYQWMSKLSFLHFPKIDILEDDIEINSICFAGGSEIEPSIVFNHKPKITHVTKPIDLLAEDDVKSLDQVDELPSENEEFVEDKKMEAVKVANASLGFMVGDVSSSPAKDSKNKEESDNLVLSEDNEKNLKEKEEELIEEEITEAVDEILPPEDFESDRSITTKNAQQDIYLSKKTGSLGGSKFIPGRGSKILLIFLLLLFATAGLVAAYIFIPKATVKVYVEPRILEKDSEITADPKQKTIDEDKKIIPGQIVETEITGTEKGMATGTKEIGDPAKGVVVIRNKLDETKTLSKGTVLTAPSGIKFVLETAISIASRSAEDGTFGKATVDVVAQTIGADGNLPSGTDLTISGYSQDQLISKGEGNFSGGTSKKVTVVSEADQKKLLAQVASNLRKQSQQKLQEKLPEKKVLEEALSEEIIKKSYNKNINDQANEFSLTLTVKFKGTAYDDKDLRQIVSKMVTTQVPEGFQLSLQDTETQADVSKLEEDGKLIFLARFKAKMVPTLNTEKIKKDLKGKNPAEAAEILKNIDYVLGSDISISPTLAPLLQNLPLLENNINVEVGLK